MCIFETNVHDGDNWPRDVTDQWLLSNRSDMHVTVTLKTTTAWVRLVDVNFETLFQWLIFQEKTSWQYIIEVPIQATNEPFDTVDYYSVSGYHSVAI